MPILCGAARKLNLAGTKDLQDEGRLRVGSYFSNKHGKWQTVF